MRITFVADAASMHSKRWIEYFYNQGIEIQWFSLSPAHERCLELCSKVDYIEMTYNPMPGVSGLKSPLYLLYAARSLKRKIATFKPDIVHTHSAGTYGAISALTPHPSKVLTPWGSDILLGGLAKRTLIKWIVSQFQFYTCDGNNTFQKLLALGAAKEKIQLIRFGVDVQKFTNSSTIQKKEAPTNIISLRNLEDIYDIESILQAAAIVSRQNTGVRFLIYGDGSKKSTLIKFAENLKLLENNTVQFMGRYNSEDLPKILSEAHIYISTSLSDSGLAASTAEAMAAGLPVISSEVGDITEWIKPQEGGHIYKPGDSKGLANAIMQLLEDSEMRMQYGKANSRKIELLNNYEVEMNKMLDIYAKIAQRL